MRVIVLIWISSLILHAATWTELTAKRSKLPGLHQEFEVSQTYKTAGGTQASKRQLVVDLAGTQWREKLVGGSGGRIGVFDGSELFSLEDGTNEFMRVKRRPKDDAPIPPPYNFGDAEWAKAVESSKRPCGIPGRDHTCIVLDVPLKKWTRITSSTDRSSLIEGSARMLLDTETGMLMSLRVVEDIDNGRGGYRSERSYVLKRFSDNAPLDAGLFRLPSDGMVEVRQFSLWNAGRIGRELAGKPAPELAVTDIQGKPLTLSELKGKTVLLDFWTTWCPPCRADAPSLDKLYRKYGERELAIISISVSEDRAIVEKYLKDHPRDFPVVLTTENDMPRPYQVGVFPTYVVIDKDGTVASAVEGDQGFADLRKRLKKAGLEIE